MRRSLLVRSAAARNLSRLAVATMQGGAEIGGFGLVRCCIAAMRWL
jgi:hypothetical protein